MKQKSLLMFVFLRFKVAEIIFNTIFIIEMLFKWVALGFKGVYKYEWRLNLIQDGERDYIGYFNDGWNVMDFMIVLTSCNLKNLTTLRLSRLKKRFFCRSTASSLN